MTEDVHGFVAARLRAVGQHYSSRRRKLVESLVRSGRPMTTAELVAGEMKLPQSTVYRNLAVLEQAGVVHRVMGSDEFSRFELTEELTGHHHHHLVCISCGGVEDFEISRGVEQGLASAIDQFSSESGFQAQSHRLDLLGTCAACVRNAARSRA